MPLDPFTWAAARWLGIDDETAERVTVPVETECCQCTASGTYDSQVHAERDGWWVLDSGDWVCPECDVPAVRLWVPRRP